MKYRLGLDLGTNSIGWAIIKLTEENQPESIINAGSRIFSDGREAKTKTSLAVGRREARSARRRRDRLLQRKKKLFNYLKKTGFLPENAAELENLKKLNPYELRSKCVNQKAEKYEIARSLYHIAQRRGFKSSRKESSEAKNMFSSAISELETALEKTGSKTLGEFYYKRQLEGKRIRTKVTQESATKTTYDFIATRELYLKEVALILDTQKQYHAEINEDFIKKIIGIEKEDTIFFQRPLKPVDVGFCQVYPKKFRGHRALPSYQKYNIEQDIFNLKVISPKGDSIELTEPQRNLIRNELTKRKERTKDDIKKILDLDEGFELNLQKDKYKGLYSEQILKKEYFGKDWDSLALSEKDRIVESIINDDDESKNLIEIAKQYKLSPEKTAEFIKLNEEIFKVKSYCHFSSEALIDALEISKKENKSPSETIKILKQSNNPETKLHEEALLPYYGKILQESVVKRTYSKQQLQQVSFDKDELEYGKISNPTVHVVLRQTQKVVNKIIEIYGRPTEINIEIIRDLKMSQEQKTKLNKVQNDNKKRNERYKTELEEAGLPNTFTNRLKLQLWEELNPSDAADRKCPYSFPERTINKTNLFGPEVEIEHILPFGSTLDDSTANKTIAYRMENKLKGKRSPFEAFGSNQEKYESILARVQMMPFKKRKRFFANAMDNFKDENKFLDRQLNDTAYIARIVRRYLGALLPEKQVQVSPGKLTAFLRHNWGLNSILNENAENTKSRDDHRHHAIDAIVIALSDKGTLQKLSKANARQEGFDKIEVPIPIKDIHESVKVIINKVITSHKPDRGIAGRLHEATYYGLRYKTKTDLDLKKIAQDFSIPNDATSLFKITSKNVNGKRTKSIDPENSLKVLIHGKNKKHYKAIIPGENYKVEFWRFKGKIQPLGISFFDINRLQNGKISYDQLRKENNIHPAAEKIFEAMKGDYIKIEENGMDKIYLVVGLDPSVNSLKIRDPNMAEGLRIRRSINVLLDAKIKKININEIGLNQYY